MLLNYSQPIGHVTTFTILAEISPKFAVGQAVQGWFFFFPSDLSRANFQLLQDKRFQLLLICINQAKIICTPKGVCLLVKAVKSQQSRTNILYFAVNLFQLIFRNYLLVLILKWPRISQGLEHIPILWKSIHTSKQNVNAGVKTS